MSQDVETALFVLSFMLPGDEDGEPSVTYSYYKMVPPIPDLHDIVTMCPNIEEDDEVSRFVRYRVTRREFGYCVGAALTQGVSVRDRWRETADVTLWVAEIEKA